MMQGWYYVESLTGNDTLESKLKAKLQPWTTAVSTLTDWLTDFIG